MSPEMRLPLLFPRIATEFYKILGRTAENTNKNSIPSSYLMVEERVPHLRRHPY